MNVVTKNCHKYFFRFSEIKTFSDIFTRPREIFPQDKTVAERIQRWLIDKGDFCSRYGRTLVEYVVVNNKVQEKPFEINDQMCYVLDRYYLAGSMTGQGFFVAMTAVILRFLDLCAQGMQNPLNFSVFSPGIKKIFNFFALPAIYGFSLYLGYEWRTLAYYMVLPILTERFLSFKWSNYFKQMHALSSSKNFDLRDFISKNIKVTFIRMCFPASLVMYLLLFDIKSLYEKETQSSILLCEKDIPGNVIMDLQRGTLKIVDMFLEAIFLSFGKMMFDLVYMLLLKLINKDADLRDPMSWMFSKFRKAPILIDWSKVTQGTNTAKKTKDFRVELKYKKIVRNDDFSHERSNFETEKLENENKSYVLRSEGRREKKVKIIDTKEAIIIRPKVKAEKVLNQIKIEVNGCVRTFQRIYDSNFQKEVWGVIIADSVEKQKLKTYETGLSNGSIGGTIRQLTGFRNCYEIRGNQDSRMIGKMYHEEIYEILQNFMSMEDALVICQELERNGILNGVSLIVFSAEAPKHKDITPVASRL